MGTLLPYIIKEAITASFAYYWRCNRGASKSDIVIGGGLLYIYVELARPSGEVSCFLNKGSSF